MEATMAYKIPYGIPREETISDKRYLNERSEEKTEDLPELRFALVILFFSSFTRNTSRSSYSNIQLTN